MPEPPERLVWDWLDAHRVPFREPTPALVTQFGADVTQPSGRPLCALGGRPLVPDQLGPLAFEPEFETGPPAPPRSLSTHAYDGLDPEASFEAARRALTEALGPGREEAASNVRGREWAAGAAWVRLLWWPEHLNRGLTYAYSDPLRGKASRLSVRPGWIPPLDAPERAALRFARRITDVPPSLPYGLEHSPAAYWRRRPPGASAGTAASAGAVFVIGDWVAVVPYGDVEAVERLDLRPGKGSGGSWVTLLTVAGGRVPVAQASPGGLLAVARRLSERTGAPVRTSEGVDA